MENSKWQRDLGPVLRQRVAQAFREGENTPVRGGRAAPWRCRPGRARGAARR